MKCLICGIEAKSRRRHYKRHHKGALSTDAAPPPIPLMAIKFGPPSAPTAISLSAEGLALSPPPVPEVTSPRQGDDLATPPAPKRPTAAVEPPSLPHHTATSPVSENGWMADAPMIVLEDHDDTESGAMPMISPPAREVAHATPHTAPQHNGATPVTASGSEQLLIVHLAGIPPAAANLGRDDVAWASTLENGVQRRICDCTGCVSHATSVVRQPSLQPVSQPKTSGVRFVHLPGLGLRSAGRVETMTLQRQMEQRTLLACGCHTCTLHRNLAKAWLAARRLGNRSPRGGKLSRPRQKPDDGRPSARRRL